MKHRNNIKQPINKQADCQNSSAKIAPLAPRWAWLLRPSTQIGLILLVGLAIYLHTLHAPFIYDDRGCIRMNPAIRDLSYYFDFDKVLALNLAADLKNSFALRPVAYLTFTLNYMVNGLDEFGYHLVNTAIHLCNAVFVYLLVTRTLQRAPLAEPTNDGSFRLSRILPLLVGLLFVVHPLQTQAVTYIVQRFTSLATLFYLGVLLLYICARTAQRSTLRWSCYGLALALTILAMKTKEVAFTLPVIMLLYDLFFLPEETRKERWLLIPFFLTMGMVPATLTWLVQATAADVSGTVLSQSMNLVNFSGISRWDYLMTQFGVIVTYLRMLLLPFGQNLDHDYRLAHSFFEMKVIASFLFLLSLFSGAIVLAVRSFREEGRNAERLIAFGILWFFVTISVESSIIPIDDLLVEYRLYLPSFGLFLAMIVALAHAVDKGFLPRPLFLYGAGLTVILLSTVTYNRNSLYNDTIRMYQDVVAKSPGKLRALDGLAYAYQLNEQYDEAIDAFSKLVEMTPDKADYQAALGHAYLGKRQFNEAFTWLRRAIALDPNNFSAYYNLGLAYLETGQPREGEKALLTALQINQHYGVALYTLAQLYEVQGRRDEAIARYRELLASYPDDRTTAQKLRQLTGR